MHRTSIVTGLIILGVVSVLTVILVQIRPIALPTLSLLSAAMFIRFITWQVGTHWVRFLGGILLIGGLFLAHEIVRNPIGFRPVHTRLAWAGALIGLGCLVTDLVR